MLGRPGGTPTAVKNSPDSRFGDISYAKFDGIETDGVKDWYDRGFC